METDKNISDFSVKYKRPEGLVPQRRIFGPGCSVNWSGQTEKLCGRCSIVKELVPLGHMSELVMLYLVNKWFLSLQWPFIGHTAVIRSFRRGCRIFSRRCSRSVSVAIFRGTWFSPRFSLPRRRHAVRLNHNSFPGKSDHFLGLLQIAVCKDHWIVVSVLVYCVATHREVQLSAWRHYDLETRPRSPKHVWTDKAHVWRLLVTYTIHYIDFFQVKKKWTNR